MIDWTIRRRVVFSFGWILSLMALMAAVAFQRLGRIESETTDLQKDSLPGARLSGDLLVNVLSNYGLLQRHVISVDADRMRTTEAALRAGQAKFDQLATQYEQTITTPEDRQRFDALLGMLPQYRQVQERVLVATTAQRADEAHAMANAELAPAYQRLVEAAEALVALNESAADASAIEISDAVAQAKLK